MPGKKAKATITLGKFPRHSLDKVLRVPKAILDQNAGKECSEAELAKFLGLKLTGPTRVEFSSALKFGLLERPSAGRIRITELARQILRPQDPKEELDSLRQAALKAPDIGDVYRHYRGENLPDEQFFDNALVDTFKIPQTKLSEFKAIFLDTLRKAQLVEEHDGKIRILDVAAPEVTSTQATAEAIKKLGKSVTIAPTDSCFESLVKSLLINRPVVFARYGISPSSSHCGPDRFRLQSDDRSGQILRVLFPKNDPASLFLYNPFYGLGVRHDHWFAFRHVIEQFVWNRRIPAFRRMMRHKTDVRFINYPNGRSIVQPPEELHLLPQIQLLNQ